MINVRLANRTLLPNMFSKAGGVAATVTPEMGYAVTPLEVVQDKVRNRYYPTLAKERTNIITPDYPDVATVSLVSNRIYFAPHPGNAAFGAAVTGVHRIGSNRAGARIKPHQHSQDLLLHGWKTSIGAFPAVAGMV